MGALGISPLLKCMKPHSGALLATIMSMFVLLCSPLIGIQLVDKKKHVTS